jgi:hypothetical protein
MEAACVYAIHFFGGVARYGDDPDRFCPVYHEKELNQQNQIAVIQAGFDGILIAIGLDSRARLDAPPVTFRREWWQALKFDFDNSRAHGPGFLITGIIVRLAGAQLTCAGEAANKGGEQDHKLCAWYARWSSENPAASEPEVWRAAKRNFPDAAITRRQIRKLRTPADGQPLKSGRKPGKTDLERLRLR